MLDGAGASSSQVPPAIVVGRTLSSYTVPGIQNNQETITYTVYNEQADPETGILLTTTLQPGVKYASATQAPDQSGPNLAWSLGTIQGYDRASVSLTVNLASPIPLQLDTGASAFATLDGGSVTNSTPAAILSARTIPADLLASTPDANTTDPFIQEEAAKLDYDPQQIFDFLHTQIGYNSYVGSLRGARGTLWSSAGNALDVASLGVALMRASGIPAQYVQGDLSFSQSQQLILSMFPASYRAVGLIPPASQVADPANDPKLLSETENHYWFQFDTGKGMQDADPLMANATIGHAFTTASATFSVVPDALRAKTTIKLNAEIFSSASALFGLGTSTTTVLDQTFNDVDLVGRFLTVGNEVSSSQVSAAIVAATTNTYTPYLIVGDSPTTDPAQDPIILGQAYQEILTSFPLGSQVLTGLFLQIDTTSPDGQTISSTETLADRIGLAARVHGGSSTLSADSQGTPLVSPFDLTTFTVIAGQIPTSVLAAEQNNLLLLNDQFAAFARGVSANPLGPSQGQDAQAAQATENLRDLFIGLSRFRLSEFLMISGTYNSLFADNMHVKAYFDSPRVTIFKTGAEFASDGSMTLSIAFDLKKNDIRVINPPGQSIGEAIAYNLVRGQIDTGLETSVNAAPSGSGGVNVTAPVSAETIMQAAQAQGIGMAFLVPGDGGLLDSLNLPIDAKILIGDALDQGNFVVVPDQSVMMNGAPRSGWYEMNPTTGETVGVLDNGDHGLGEQVVRLLGYIVLQGQRFALGLLTGFTIDGILAAVKKIVLIGVAQFLPPYIKNNPIYKKGPALLVLYGIYNFVKQQEAKFLLNIQYFWFNVGLATALAFGLKNLITDPSLPAGQLDPSPSGIPLGNQYRVDTSQAASLSAGSTQGSVKTSGTQVSGSIQAGWSSSATTAFTASSLSASGATVLGAGGSAVGVGVVSLGQTSAVPLEISGTDKFAVAGDGTLAFYPATASLGVSGDWTDYSATATGNVVISLTTDGLTLNGTPLPAGTYTILASSIAFGGAGRNTSPDFATAATLTVHSTSVNVSSASGSVAIGGKSLDPTNGFTLLGYTGEIGVSADGTAETVSLNGIATNLMRVSASPAGVTTDPNTPATLTTNVSTSLADSYAITAQAPLGWLVSVDGSTDQVTVTPAPGIQAGVYDILLTAQSATQPGLIAEAIVPVTITPTSPGASIAVVPDTIFTVPAGGAGLPTAYIAEIHNTGPSADTFNLTFPNPPAGFTISSSLNQVTIPAGETGMVGVYLIPTGAIPSVGTQASFTVTATSATSPSIAPSQTVTLTIPEIHGVTVVSSPNSVSTIPGTAVTDTLTITNAGNVPENAIALAATTSTGLTITGLAPVSLAPGQSTTETVSLTPDASTPLNSELAAAITATYGPSASPQTQTLNVIVDVVVPGAAAIANASIAANQLGNTGLVGRLGDLSTALTNLVQNPTSTVFKGQALANLDSLISQLTGDPFLSGYTAGLTAAQAALPGAVTAAQVQTVITNLGTALDSLATTITDDAAHAFTLSLSPDRNIVEPGAPEVFDIVMTNKGNTATTYDLGVAGLPSGVTAVFSQPSVTLQPGQSIGPGNNAVTLTLTESGTTLVPANFTVQAAAKGAMEINQSTPGFLTLRDEAILVASVVTNPPFTDPGGQVDVSAKIQSAVNESTQIMASYTVSDSTGKVLFTSTAVPVTFAVSDGLKTVDLGSFDTTGFSKGVNRITVNVSSSSGQPIPGATATTSFLIGQPVTADLSTSPITVPTGSDVVTSTVTVTTHATYPTPLTLQGAVTTPAPGTSVALFQSGGKTYAYESGTGGIDALDVTDPTNPALLEVFGQNDITNGQFGFNVARVVKGELIVGTSNGNNGSVFNLLVYSLSNPASPQLVSNTTIDYRFLSDLLVNSTGTAAYVPTNGFFHFGSDIYQDFGDFVSLDLTDPTKPALGSSLFNDQGQPDGGDMNQFGGTLVNDQIAYSAGLTPGGSTIIGNTGNLLVVNIADPKNMSLIGQLKIPGTVNILNVATHGNRALVIGSAGTESNIYNPNLTGVFNHLTLTVLDITDPANPQILGSTFVTNEQFPLNEAGAKTDVVDLGNGDFAVSDTDNNGNPALLVVDPSNPDNIIVSAAQVPSGVHGITVSGNLLYATTSSGLSIYQIGQLISDPVTISLSLPPGTAADIVSNSYNIPPTQVMTGTTADTLVWDRSFSAGDTTFSFNWQTKIGGVQVGQSVPVTVGASVSYVNQGTPGTLNLPGTSVTGASIISITPASQTEQPGGTVTYDVRLENPTAVQVTYNLDVTGLPFGVTVGLPPSSIAVPAGGIVDVPLTLKSLATAQAGTTPFTVTAEYILFASDNITQLGDFKGSAGSSLTIAGQPVIQPDPEAHGVVVSLTPARAVAGQGTSATYVIQLTNVGSIDDHFNLSVAGLPSGVSASFGQDQFSLDVPSGASNFRDLTLTLTIDTGTPPGDIPFTVTATSTSLPTISGSAQGTLGVVASGVTVSLDPQSEKPGAGFHFTVTNTGTVQDTFDLTLAGPAALVSTLGASKITLAPGASQVVPITTGGVTFAVPGSLDLTAMATSETSPAVRNGASANLDIAASTGLTAQFSPPSQTLAAPGQTSFLLQVNNTGNVEDSYSAVITGTTGPVVASLVGFDGQPTASIPLFRLPGLSSGALTLDATMTGPGQATVTVLVTSLSTGQTTTLTASITSGASVVVSDGPQITSLKRYGIHMKPTTIVLTFDQPLDPTRAQDVREYHLVGPAGRTIRIKSAVYDASTMTVTLIPKERINLHHTYKLTVYGATPNGLTGSSGLLLDGKDEGQPGSNYVATITFGNLVLPANWNPRWTAQFVHHKSHPAAKQAEHSIRIGKHPLSQRPRPFQTHGAAKHSEARSHSSALSTIHHHTVLRTAFLPAGFVEPRAHRGTSAGPLPLNGRKTGSSSPRMPKP